MLRYLLTASLMVTVSVYVAAQDKEAGKKEQPAKQESKKEAPPAKQADRDSVKYIYDRIETAAKNADFAARKRNFAQLKESVEELQRLVKLLEALERTEKTIEELNQLKNIPGVEKFFPQVPQQPAPNQPGKPKPGAQHGPGVRIFVNGKELPPDQVRIQVLPAKENNQPRNPPKD